MKQAVFDFEVQQKKFVDMEQAKKEKILDAIQKFRAELIRQGRAIAYEIATETGTVSSTRLIKEMHARGINFQGIDKRCLGVVFRAGKNFKEVGRERSGSHGRDVRVWALVS